MSRQLQFQKGYVSDPIKTRYGIVFKIRYRVPAAKGKWKHKCETLYGLAGKKAARAILNERVKSVSTVPNQQASEMTLQEFIGAFYRPKLLRNQLKPSTMESYKSIIERHILPVLGDLCIADIVPLHIEEFVQGKTEEGYGPKSIKNQLRVLSGIFNVGVQQDVILRSPVRDSHMPKVHKREKQIWSPDQVRKIIETAPAMFKSLIAVVALTGVRLGELLAIQWKHVDFRSGSLMIAQSLWRGQIVPPKTEGSIRRIPMGQVLCEILKSHYQTSRHCDQGDFVFCRKDGSPLHPDVVRKDVLYPILDRLGIERRRGESGFHAFRHCAGSFVHSETGNLKLAQTLLGHTNLTTTADIYTHRLTEAGREASEALEKKIFGNLFPVVPNLGTGNRKLVN